MVMTLMFDAVTKIEGNRVFDKRFKGGLFLGLSLYVVLNVVSYILESWRYEEQLNEFQRFSPQPRFRFGFPLYWEGYNFGYFFDGIPNLIFWMMFGILFGLLARYLFAPRGWKRKDL